MIKRFVVLKLILSASLIPQAQTSRISWPANQLLPTFPASAQTQDFIILRETPSQWQAERSVLLHSTGRRETDGWVCQPGIDSAGRHMIYGPYDTNIVAGPNVAEFRIKTNHNIKTKMVSTRIAVL